MFLNNYIRESDEELEDDVDLLADKDPDTAEGIEAMAREVETHMATSALESLSYFEGGEEAVKNFSESAEVQAMIESNGLRRKTYVFLNRNDDLQRRSNLACLVLAKNNKDPLWTKLAQNRIKEKKIRNAIYAKYGNKSKVIAKKSQQVHMRNAHKLPSLPKIHF